MSSHPITVLLVEDNLGDATLVREFLSKGTGETYHIDHCIRLDEAITHLDDEPCDIILLDLSLPDSRGLSTYDTLQQRTAGIPIVILTGFNDDVVAAQAIKNGAKDFLSKNSLDGKILERTIRYALERVHWEQTIRRSEERISRLEKIEALGRLSAGIAHNFNNLLTVIIGNCDLIAGKTEADEQLRHRVQVIRDTASRASSFTRSVMAFGRRLPVKACIFDINIVFKELEPLLTGSLGKDIRFTFDLHPEAGLINSDPAQIEQVIINLALNARESMPGGGPVMLRTMPMDFNAPFEGVPDCVSPGKYSAIIVSDSGCGIDNAHLHDIFEPFYTTKEECTGSGMGLASVFGMVSQNKGFIQVVSQPGAGATFTIYLPRHVADVPHEQRVESAVINGHGAGRETVLLVEDDASIREMLAEALEEVGYTVINAMDGKSGLETFIAHADAVSAVVSDIAMPRMDGRDLVKEIRKINPEIPVLLMTGQPIHKGGVNTDVTSSVRLLIKPFSPRILASAIREEIDLVKSRAQAPTYR